MSHFDKNNAYSSPMDVVFSWATPQKTDGTSSAIKRKSKDDSGYVSPCSSFTKIRSIQSTPYEGIDVVTAFTPLSGGRGERMAKKRLSLSSTSKTQSSDPYCSAAVTAESFPDFLMEESMYSEPMDIGTPRSSNMPEEFVESLISNQSSPKELDLQFEMSMCETCPTTPKTSLPQKSALSTIRRGKKSPSPQKRLISSAPGQAVYWRKLKKRKYLCGLEKVDFIDQLGVKASYPNILSKIFNQLSDADLASVTMVSKMWRNVCLSNSAARHRWHKYISERRQNRENLPLLGTIVGKLKRQSLRDYNHSTPLVTRQPTSPPASPSKVRFLMFQKEAKKLKENETLMECPRCRHPSACSPSIRTGVCQSLFCQWKFCTICKTELHPSGDCPVLTPATPTTPTKRCTQIGSKQSRRNLRRL